MQNLQEYGRNPNNGYMDDIFLDLVKQKQRLGKPLTQEEQEFLEQKKDTNALAVVGSEIARTGEKTA